MIGEMLFQRTALGRVIGGVRGGGRGRAVGRVNMVGNYIAYPGLRRGRNNAKSNIREQRFDQLSGVKIRQSEHGD